MRQFDDYEEEFIKLIGEIGIESDETFSKFLQDNYFTIKSKTALIVDHKAKSVYYYMSPIVFDNQTTRVSQLKKFWALIALIEYLDEKRYIKRIPVRPYKNLQLMCQQFDDSNKEVDKNIY
jgi:hypothetical protein